MIFSLFQIAIFKKSLNLASLSGYWVHEKNLLTSSRRTWFVLALLVQTKSLLRIWTWIITVSKMSTTLYMFPLWSRNFCRTPRSTRHFSTILCYNIVNTTIMCFTLKFEWKFTFYISLGCSISDSAGFWKRKNRGILWVMHFITKPFL